MKDILKSLKAQEKQVLKQAKVQAQKIRRAIAVLKDLGQTEIKVTISRPKGRRKMSASARRKIAAARWAKQKTGK